MLLHSIVSKSHYSLYTKHKNDKHYVYIHFDHTCGWLCVHIMIIDVGDCGHMHMHIYTKSMSLLNKFSIETMVLVCMPTRETICIKRKQFDKTNTDFQNCWTWPLNLSCIIVIATPTCSFKRSSASRMAWYWCSSRSSSSSRRCRSSLK